MPRVPDGVRLHSPPGRAVPRLRTTAQSLRRTQVGSAPPPSLIPLSQERFPATARELVSALPVWPRTHPLEQLGFQKRLDHVVGRGEVPRLVNEVDGFEPGWEGILQ